MFTLRCTKKLLSRMEGYHHLQPAPATTLMGDWYADLLIDANDDYSGGHLWETYRSNFEGCILRDYPRSFPGADLAFEIVFCAPTTPTRGSTWGQLKLLYR